MSDAALHAAGERRQRRHTRAAVLHLTVAQASLRASWTAQPRVKPPSLPAQLMLVTPAADSGNGERDRTSGASGLQTVIGLKCIQALHSHGLHFAVSGRIRGFTVRLQEPAGERVQRIPVSCGRPCSRNALLYARSRRPGHRRAAVAAGPRGPGATVGQGHGQGPLGVAQGGLGRVDQGGIDGVHQPAVDLAGGVLEDHPLHVGGARAGL